MIRKLYERSFAIQRQMVISYLARRIVCQSSSYCSHTLSKEVAPVQRIQRLKFSTFECDKNFGVKNKIENNNEVNPIAIELHKKINCTRPEANEVYEFLSANSDTVNLDAVIRTVKWLKRLGATPSVIVKNCHLLLIPLERLMGSYERLSRSRWEQVDDFVPLLIIRESKIKRLQMYVSHVIRDRIYLFNEYFSIESHIISHYCSRHEFVFEIELELMKRKLDMLLNCNVSPENILRDLNVLARAEDVIKERLEYLKMCGIERVMPWMIKCQDQVLHRAIEIRKSLGTEQNKTMELLTQRLHWHGKTAISMFTKNKFLRQLNSATASELLDELLKIFSSNEISANISLLSHPLSHVKIRVAELTALEAYHVPPRVLSMSDSNFEEYLNHTKNQ